MERTYSQLMGPPCGLLQAMGHRQPVGPSATGGRSASGNAHLAGSCRPSSSMAVLGLVPGHVPLGVRIGHQAIRCGPGRISRSPRRACREADRGWRGRREGRNEAACRGPPRPRSASRPKPTREGTSARPLGSAGVVPIACRTRHEMPGPTCRAAPGAVWFPCRGRRIPCFARWHGSCGVMRRVLPVPPLRRSFACLCSAP
jgi:hypothetical protein